MFLPTKTVLHQSVPEYGQPGSVVVGCTDVAARMATGSARCFFDDDSAVLGIREVGFFGQLERERELGSTGDNFPLVEEVQQLLACDHLAERTSQHRSLSTAPILSSGRPDNASRCFPMTSYLRHARLGAWFERKESIVFPACVGRVRK